jgi:OmpA-OmpF porin, OOP family
VRSSFDGNAVSVGGTIPDADRDRIISYLKSTLGPQFVFATIAGTGATKTAIASPSLKSGVSDKKPVSTPEQSTLNLPTIYFATNSAEVSSDSKAFLEQAVVLMKQLPAGTVVRISGFTGSTGNPAANMKLSQRRANAVRQVLVDAGVNPAILSAKGYGIYHSAASENETMEGRSSTMMQGRLHEDRRVEFRIAQQ